MNIANESGKVDGPKGGKWTVAKVGGSSKVDSPSESRLSPILNHLWGNRTVQGVKVDGSRGESGQSWAGFEIKTKILSCDRARFLEPLSKSVQHSVKINRNRTIR